MKLVIAVVRDDCAGTLADQLTQEGFGATKLASTGGFLKAGNSTFFVGVEAERLEGLLALIRGCCGGEARRPKGAGPAGAAEPATAGATVFVVDIHQWVKA